MIALVLLVHLLAVVGLVRMPGPLIPVDVSDTPTLEAVLLPPPAPPAPPKPRPIARAPRPQPKPAAPRPEPEVPAPAPEPAPPLATSPQGATEMAAGSGGEGSAAAPAAAAAPAPSGGPQGGVNGVRYSAPPSATMHYASFVNGVQNPDGLIRWEQDGSRYRLAVETRVLWFRFAFQSSGAVTEQGLLPERYEERRRNKVEASRIDTAAGTVAFASGALAPFPPGAQDRFSVFLQLVGLVRGNPQRYLTPGVTEAFQVADTRDVEPMQVQYVGEVEVDTGQGVVRAKHFVRLPRRANDRRRVEVWLAQSLGWMPVRLRQTEPDGTQIDLVYRGKEGP
ncbi:hypothetical protein A9P79_12280 [Cupriavidus taiwanensis]|uniref:DUF3108 domain-containing protein n=1 Tax=Cupriavidus taiwanensis TaxID=164546 RepID=UPI001F00FC02|nr:DUF3108 domain-containing protein [Cupriavidus taiwanensis]ULX55631.1 hypothetical protein A9P79_12280 [Cupriavidus taiwanensis]